MILLVAINIKIKLSLKRNGTAYTLFPSIKLLKAQQISLQKKEMLKWICKKPIT